VSKNLLTVQNLYKSFISISGLKLVILKNINFSFNTNEEKAKMISILAPFGAGKSTLLRLISGLESPDEGKIILGEEEIISADGNIIYVPEKPASFPWYDVRRNIEFPLKAAEVKNPNSVKNLISLVGLSGYEDHFPHNSSYGFRFRVTLARALVVNPKLILIDDSFKIMDAETRNEIYLLLNRINKELNINFLIATTNIHEAIFLSDEIFLMKKDPGYIFRQISVNEKFHSTEFVVTNEVISFRNEIESYFRKEGNIETTNFSI